MVTLCLRNISSRENLRDLHFVYNLGHLHQTKALRDLLSKDKLSGPSIEQIIRFESEVHDNDMSKVLCCLKTNLNPETVDKIVSLMKKPSFKNLKDMAKKAVDWMMAKILAFKEMTMKHFPCLESNSSSTGLKKKRHFLILSVRTFLINIDLIKDVFLLAKLYSILGGIQTIIEKPTIFQNTVRFHFQLPNVSHVSLSYSM